jgi:DNA polymerase-3 subunit gamma/tau
MTVLALKYRPQTFSDVVGQRISAVVLDRMVSAGDVPTGLLFSGPKGSGKTSMARILGNSLGSTEFIEVDAASHGLVDDVRRMIDSLRYSSGAENRVVIYDEAHSMTREAFNALLKTLEEAPAATIFILVTTEPEKIPETVKSRLMEFSFRKISPAEIESRLFKIIQAEGIPHSQDLITYLATRADGSMRDAIMTLDQCWKAGITDKETFLEMAGEEDVAPELVVSMLSGDHARVFQVADDLSQRVPDPNRLASSVAGVLKDVLILKSGGTVDAKPEDLDRLKTIALHLESERIVAGLKMLWDLRTRVRSSTDPRGNLDLALALITDIFTRGRQPLQVKKVERTEKVAPVVAPTQEEPRRLTLAEL